MTDLNNIFPIKIDPEELLWDHLIEKIVDGDVIPVIGPDVLIEGGINAHQYIIKACAEMIKMESEPNSFSEFVYDYTYKKMFKSSDYVYYIVNNIFKLLDEQPEKAEEFSQLLNPSSLLMRLLEIRQFPFVITTSFTPVVEQVMRDVWKDELRVMRFSNKPHENDDITNKTDLRKPTVYYMFGKVCEEIHSYVLTDIDILDFCSSWLSNSDRVRPQNLCSVLKDKYLLFLGNNYSDWLFRFVWYSMRRQNMSEGMLTYDNAVDQSFVAFLTREDVFTKKDPSYVVEQILSRIKKKLADIEKTKFDKPEKNVDVFISYSRSDYYIAEKLYKALTEQGKRVWFDKKNITSGGNFMDEIYQAINDANYFIPIFSENIIKEKKERHTYRNEWNKAITVAVSMGRTYIIPLAEEGFDFYKANIPDEINSHNAIFYKNGENMECVAKKIIHTMNNN